MSDQCIKATGVKCYCVSCCESRAEAANDRACWMNVADAEGGNYEDYPGYREATRRMRE